MANVGHPSIPSGFCYDTESEGTKCRVLTQDALLFLELFSTESSFVGVHQRGAKRPGLLAPAFGWVTLSAEKQDAG
jgi:hypothetical protein